MLSNTDYQLTLLSYWSACGQVFAVDQSVGKREILALSYPVITEKSSN